MLQGLSFALVAGLLISFHNVFITRTGEKLGFWETTTLVHGLGFLLALVILFITGRSAGSSIRDVNYLYVFGCLVGVLVVFSVMQGVVRLGVIFAVPMIIFAQIVGSVIISRFGLFEEKMVIPSVTNLVGIILLLIGAVLSQIRT
ncbi:DMT family transporter [bacterium]|nr:DMT family transporter [bacterium]